jgi:hypothetical protein
MFVFSVSNFGLDAGIEQAPMFRRDLKRRKYFRSSLGCTGVDYSDCLIKRLGHMYSANRASEQGVHSAAEKSATPHRDVSPELKEVMHLLKMMESGQDLKGS